MTHNLMVDMSDTWFLKVTVPHNFQKYIAQLQ